MVLLIRALAARLALHPWRPSFSQTKLAGLFSIVRSLHPALKCQSGGKRDPRSSRFRGRRCSAGSFPLLNRLRLRFRWCGETKVCTAGHNEPTTVRHAHAALRALCPFPRWRGDRYNCASTRCPCSGRAQLFSLESLANEHADHWAQAVTRMRNPKAS